MDHKPLIIANWKMNPTTQKEAEHLFSAIEKEIRKIKEAEVVICPPFVYLSSFCSQQADDSRKRRGSDLGQIRLGGQDCFWEEKPPVGWHPR